MKSTRLMLPVFLLSMFLLGTAQIVFGCSCMGRASVLDEFENSQDVFIGEITSIESTDDPLHLDGVKGAKMVVQKVFKGDLKEGDEVFLEQGGGADCRLTYDTKSVGWKLLVYNSPYEGRRSISICGRSRGVGGATDDLLYLENLPWTKGKTRISGEISFGFFGDVPEGHNVSGKKIRIIGKKRAFTATSDSTGVYEMYDVPPGQYFIEPEIPAGWKLNEYMLEKTLQGSSGVIGSPGLIDYLESKESKGSKRNRFLIQVDEGRHVSFDFQYEIDNAIRGTLLAPNGKPLQGICIHAVPADREASLYGTTGCTDDTGKFEISELNLKKYILVINGDDEIPGREPIPMTFYPGVSDRSKAAIIEIGEGIKPTLPAFRVPRVFDTITLKGKLSYADGTPVRTRKIQFKSDDPTSKFEKEPYNYTESDGSFTIKIIKGQAGRLRAEYYTGKKDLELCPDWRKAIIESSSPADWMITAATEWIEVKADRDVRDIKFVFPFNACDKE